MGRLRGADIACSVPGPSPVRGPGPSVTRARALQSTGVASYHQESLRPSRGQDRVEQRGAGTWLPLNRSMRHLFLSREYPPAPYATGGIGTYVLNIAHLLAEAGEDVHVIAQRWRGATRERDVQLNGRLTVHRVSMDTPVRCGLRYSTHEEVHALQGTAMPARAWNHNAAIVAESIVEEEAIDVVEAQEWEAPLFPFLQRRAMGLGPAARPPCVVHLHSPTEFVWRHNDWPLSTAYVLQMRRQEECCIAAADALLCPSAFLADEASARYGLQRDRIAVVPYPIGVTRGPQARTRGSLRGPVLYVGRIERRKGLVEFVEAAVAVARDTEDVRFEFIGADVMGPDGQSTREFLERRILPSLRARFSFRGEVPREALWARYAEARFAVVPSRWENLPNTCIEAMAMGVPVLISPVGGMAEMVVDSESGWVAPSTTAAGFDVALRRALRASDEELATMGAAARKAVERHCGNAGVLERQLAFRRDVVATGACRSLRLPGSLPASLIAVTPDAGAMRGAATFVPRTPALALPPDAGAAAYAIRLARQDPTGSVALVAPGFVADIEGLRAAAHVLRTNGDAAVVTGWARLGAHDKLLTPLCPAFPYQWLANEAWPVAILRSAAVLEAGEVPEDLVEPYAAWFLVNAVMCRGWKALSVPWVLATSSAEPAPSHFEEVGGERRLEMRRRLRSRFAAAIARDANALLTILEPQPPDNPRPAIVYGPDRWTGLTIGRALRLGPRDQLALLGELAHNPWRLGAWIRTCMAARDGVVDDGSA